MNCEKEPDGDAIDLLTRTSTRTSLKRARGQCDAAPSGPATKRPPKHAAPARAPSESPCKSEDGGDPLDLLSYMASAARHRRSKSAECNGEVSAEREMSDASTEPTPSSPSAATFGASLADVEVPETTDEVAKCQDFAAGMQAMVEFASSNPVEFCAWLAQFRALVQQGASVDMVRTTVVTNLSDLLAYGPACYQHWLARGA